MFSSKVDIPQLPAPRSVCLPIVMIKSTQHEWMLRTLLDSGSTASFITVSAINLNAYELATVDSSLGLTTMSGNTSLTLPYGQGIPFM